MKRQASIETFHPRKKAKIVDSTEDAITACFSIVEIWQNVLANLSPFDIYAASFTNRTARKAALSVLQQHTDRSCKVSDIAIVKDEDCEGEIPALPVQNKACRIMHTIFWNWCGDSQHVFHTIINNKPYTFALWNYQLPSLMNYKYFIPVVFVSNERLYFMVNCSSEDAYEENGKMWFWELTPTKDFSYKLRCFFWNTEKCLLENDFCASESNSDRYRIVDSMLCIEHRFLNSVYLFDLKIGRCLDLIAHRGHYYVTNVDRSVSMDKVSLTLSLYDSYAEDTFDDTPLPPFSMIDTYPLRDNYMILICQPSLYY